MMVYWYFPKIAAAICVQLVCNKDVGIKTLLANTILFNVAFPALEALAAFTAKFATAMENRLHMQAS